ncbi:DUF2690 domain-containing protein [Streptomyces sp. V4-01]|uniref:DUF2690 domain-containing protein n=1 Tax=Actinacidiphila polyblastidii TaxID=3110430 RepID=A0ABU7PME2_9ACTN|nr:DUF2690 domain-containing protein [Streptomyces sp. V4-01]
MERLASELRALRALAGDKPFWKMARQCSVSKSALAAAAAGRRLPSEKVLTEFVRACGGDGDWWRERWEQARSAEAELAAATPGKVLAKRRPGVVEIMASRPLTRLAEAGDEHPEYDLPSAAEPRRPRWILIVAGILVSVAAGMAVAWIGAPFHSTHHATPAPPNDGTDPQLAGCADDAMGLAVTPVRLQKAVALRSLQLPKGTVVGTVTLRYSPRCAGAWARFDPDPVIDTKLGDDRLAAITVWDRRPADTTQETWQMGHVDESYSALLLTGMGCVIAGARIDVINEDVSAQGETLCLPTLSSDRRSSTHTPGR